MYEHRETKQSRSACLVSHKLSIFFLYRYAKPVLFSLFVYPLFKFFGEAKKLGWEGKAKKKRKQIGRHVFYKCPAPIKTVPLFLSR